MKKQYAYSPGLGKKVEVFTLCGGTPKPAARKRRMAGNAYARVLLKTMAAAAKASNTKRAFIWIWLQYETWRTRSATVSISNGELEQYGITRQVKYLALADYERAGLITIQKQNRHSLVVTVVSPDYQAIL
jgi:hypothetical protein